MKVRFSKTVDRLIFLAAAIFLAVVLVGGYQYLGYDYPWETPIVGPANEFYRALRSMT